MRKLSNYASTVITDPIPAVAGAGPVTGYTFGVSNLNGELSRFPDVDSVPTDYAYCTLENTLGQVEIVKLISINIALSTVTVDRGNGAFPAGEVDAPPAVNGMLAFTAGSRFECRATAGLFNGLLQRNGDTIHGGVFGTAPPAPANSVKIIEKHSIAPEPPVIGDATIGQLLFNAQTKKLFAGAVDGLNALELFELVPGIFYYTEEPVAKFRTLRTLWFDSDPEHMVLKIYNGTDFIPVFSLGVLENPLILNNNIALRGKHTDGTTIYDLAMVNAANEIVLGDADAPIVKIAGALVQFSPRIRLRGAVAGHGYWDFFATAVGGTPTLQLTPVTGAGVAAEVEVLCFDDDSAARLFRFTRNGQFKVPVLVPVEPDDVVCLNYLETTIAGLGQYKAAGHIGVTTGGVVTIGFGYGITTVTYGGTGIFLVNLPAPGMFGAGSRTIIHAMVDANVAIDYTATGTIVNATQIRIQITHDGTPHNGSFFFSIYDFGAP